MRVSDKPSKPVLCRGYRHDCGIVVCNIRRKIGGMSEIFFDEADYDHVWHSRMLMTDRVGQKLRVKAIGTLNSALIEFEDGYECVTSCFGYRRSRALTDCKPAAEIVQQQ